ncbi:MAG: hypothetical protein ACN6OI_08055 [Flavobacterium sp.]|uniref:hypothetical protein n=1 Tax=Flavobacterium sp. TaxID=239 RepID=UPI003D0D16F5
MNYQVEHYHGRTLFTFYTNKVTFEEVSELIDKVIQPDKKFEIEITSWTQAFSFKIDNLEIYFEHFYNGDELFSFELLPRLNNSSDDLYKLENLIKKLSVFIIEE